MQPGSVIGSRFEVEHRAGSGGMGQIYRARDRRSGAAVALKLLYSASPEELGRFTREAQALASLRLPGVVRYIAHGLTREGKPYLAMEWLTGETLSQRLARGVLDVSECLALAARVASTLGAVHRLGIVHRDLKPSNLLLVDGDIERTTLLDFGIVRISGLAQQLTMPGVIVGTPGYMAPEQARGQVAVDARADVFALGCVIFRCLTGRPAFAGTDALAAMAKVLLEEPPPLRQLRGEVPEVLEDLVARMLSKWPEDRPCDGAAAAMELAAIQQALASGRAAHGGGRTAAITTGERRVMCLILARYGSSDVEETRSEEEEIERAHALQTLIARYNGRFELINGTAPIVALADAGAPTDLALRAASCALELRAVLRGAPVALVTGRAELTQRMPVGELVDRAAQLLPSHQDDEGGVRIDDVTSGLLGARFDVTRNPSGWLLRGPRAEHGAPPQLLGKPTTCVGRARELALLSGELMHCMEEPMAGALLVTGAAGLGKSRIREELIRTLRERGERIEIWLGQANPISAGSAFGLISHALRRAMGILDGEPIEARRRKVSARVARHASLGAGAQRIAAFIGEMVGAPFPEDDDVQLRAARRSSQIMSDQLRLVWEELVRAECQAQPLLLVLEDLHWGDLPSVMLVDAALRNVRDLPFMVMALARPEVRETFPKLWDSHLRHELHLTPLTRRASEMLVRGALGVRVSAALVGEIAARAEGNPFFLEEQIRAVAEGKREGLPETVLAMVQARLGSLDAATRRALRAGSVFGEAFWSGGVAALLGGADVRRWLSELESREVILRQEQARFQGEPEYRFRHALVREAAYGMLTDRDRRLGHALAGDWLERAGETDSMALAEHFERGGAPARAATAYRRAAEEALRGNDLGAAIERAARGFAHCSDAAVAGSLRLIEAEARLWRGEFALAEQRGMEAIDRLAPGTATWFIAVARVVTAAARLGGFDRVERWMERARCAVAVDDAVSAREICLGHGAQMLVHGGRYVAADALIQVLEQAASGPRPAELEFSAHLNQARAFRARASGDLGVCLTGLEAALSAFEAVGDHRNACIARQNLGFLYSELGDYRGAEVVLRAALSAAERMQIDDAIVSVRHNLGPVLAQLGRLAEARTEEGAAMTRLQQQGDARTEGLSRIYLAQIELLAGDLRAAEREARAAAELLKDTLPLCAYASAVQARALLGLGRATEGCVLALRAYELLASHGTEEGETLIRLVHAEALAAGGDRRAASTAILAARDDVLARAAKIGDPAWRARFLRGVPDNARTLDLAARWHAHVSAEGTS